MVVVALVAYAVYHFSGLFIERSVRRLIVSRQGVSKEAERKREDTLIRIISTAVAILVWIVAVLIIVEEAGYAIGPILAAAGVAGLALGFGGQYLIRDLISGLFIVLENQYRIGDVVSISGASGVVEDITLRMTTLRDLDGVVHHIPHGDVSKVSNMTKQFARINLDIGVAYNSDLEKVIEVINKVGLDLAEDEQWKDVIIKPPQFLRVDDFADSAVVIKILGDTQPLHQWEVAGELRKRIKIAFDTAGIEIPFPQRVIHQG